MKDLLGSPGKWSDYQRILNAHETKNGTVEITLKFPTLRYLDEFIGLSCSVDMLSMGLFPNAKEITESFAAYRACRRFVPFELDDPNVNVVVVGDGSTPRTAATFAFRSRWMCHSIDPKLNKDKIPAWRAGISRLNCIPGLVQTTSFDFDKLVIVAPHSHAPMNEVINRLKGKERHVIVMPCCERQDVGKVIPDHKYDDWGIQSPQRTVMVYNNV